MEQFSKDAAQILRNLSMRQIFLALLMVFISGCKRPMSNPHNVDPVYLQLKRDGDELKQTIDKYKDEVERLNAQYEKYTAENGDKRELVAALYEQKSKLEKSEEKYLYIQEKLKEIIKTDAAKYKEAFKNNGPWPDPQDWETFKLQKSFDETKYKEWSAERRIRKLLPKKSPAPIPPTEGSHE